jgi:hypothetical protein
MALVVGLFVCVTFAVGLVRDWKARTEEALAQPSYWPWSTDIWFGFRRVTLPGELFFIALTASVAFPGMEIPLAIFVAAVLLPLSLTIFLFNWPRALVPPALRQQDGVFVSYLKRRRARAN